MERFIRRFITVLLTALLIVTDGFGNAVIVKAEGKDPEVLMINGESAAGLTIEYGQPLNLSVSGYEGEGTVAFQYGTALQVEAEDWQTLENGYLTLDPGTYYFNYSITEEETTRFDVECKDYEVKVIKGTLAAPSNLKWEGSKLTWDEVKTTNKNGNLLANSVKKYIVNIYKDGSLLSTKESVINSYNNLDNDIVADPNYKNGSYTFDVQAVVADGVTNYYSGADKSTVSNPYIVPLVTIIYDNGISATDPDHPFLLLPGNGYYDATPIFATTKAEYNFKNWKGEGVTFEENEKAESRVKINSDYAGETTLNIYAYSIDKTLPVIGDLSGANNTSLSIVAHDNETGIVRYAFSKATSEEKVDDAEWIDAVSPIKTATTLIYTLTSGGVYYFYATDSDGNTVKSNPINVTEVTYKNYCRDNNKDHDKTVYMIGDASKFVLETPTSQGWKFVNWKQNDSVVTSITHDTNNGVTLNAQWEKQSTELKDLENIEKVYDGKTTTLSADLKNENTGVLTYQWYKDGEILTGQTSKTLDIKDVADSGEYYVVVTAKDENGDIVDTNTSNTAVVSITKAQLNISVSTVNVVYGADVPELKEVYNGFVNSEDNKVITVGKIKTTYTKGADVGDYPISVEGFAADNYELIYNLGIVHVNARTEGVTYAFKDPTAKYSFIEATEIKPEVVVTVDKTELKAGKDYDVEYHNNAQAGDATAKIILKGNYSGNETLEFKIAKATYEVVASIEDWKYGDNAKTPTISTNPGNGEVTYYYGPYGETDLTKFNPEKPTEAGKYGIYASISETNNYEKVNTEINSFEIKKRVINIKAVDSEWYYDGNEHSDDRYEQTGDSFVKGQGFTSVIVTGKVKEVTTADGVANKITYTLNASTDPNNYEINATDGKLTVLSVALNIPSGAAWNKNNQGTVTWTAVSKNNLVTQYKLQLYAFDGESYIAVGDPVSTTDTKYDFSSAIKAYAKEKAAEGKAYSYFFTIQSISSGGSDAKYYLDSPVSEYKGEVFTAYINSSANGNVESIKIDGGIDPIVMLAGESVEITAKGKKGYTPRWNEITDSELAISNNILYLFTGLFTYERVSTLTFNANATHSIVCETLSVATSDAAPQVNSFTAENATDYSNVKFSFTLSDGVDIAAWMISTSATTPKANDANWVTTGVTGDSDTSYSGTLTVTESGTYYIYVKDSANNIQTYYTYSYDESGEQVSKRESISIYKVELQPGEGLGKNISLYKIGNTGLNIPECTFTKAGFAFQNWYGTTGIYEDKGVYSENSDEVLVAHWTDEKYTYNVNYFYMDVEGNYPSVADDTKTFESAYGEIITSATPSIQQPRTGFTLDGSTGHLAVINIDAQGKSINIYYSRNQYKIDYRYTLPDKTEPTVETKYYYYEADLTDAFLDTNKPTKAGYNFVGWDFGDSGSRPEKMPYQDIEVTGYFTPAPGIYHIVSYFQNYELGASGEYIPSANYTLSSSYTRNCVHNDTFIYNTGNVTSYVGYTASKLAYSYGAPSGSTVPETASTSVEAKAYAIDEEHELYINVYYTRNYYDITLNVWQGPVGEEMIYNHVWHVLYNSPVNMAKMAEYESETWDTLALPQYLLASYKSYSTGEAKNVMPAGDVTITRQYVMRTIGTYKLELYVERTNQNDVYDKKEFTYYGNVGTSVNAGSDDTYTINIKNFNNSIRYLDSYHEKAIDDSNISGISGPDVTDGKFTNKTITITDTNNGKEMQILRIYLEKNTVNATVRYYFNDGTDNDNHEIAKVTFKGKWGQTKFPVEPIALFDTVEGGSFKDKNYEKFEMTGNVGGVSPDLYDFRNNNYIVCYNQTTFKTLDQLNASYSTTFGVYGSTENIYYYKINGLNQHGMDVGYNSSNLDHGKNEFVQLTHEYDGKTYKVRLANEALFYKDTTIVPDIPEYPATSQSNYVYTVSDDNIKDGYTHIPDTNYYYDDEYIYIANKDNIFVPGSRLYYTFPSTEIGYQDVTDFLSNYKATWKDDPVAEGARVYTNYFNSKINDDSKLTITFINERRILYYSVTGNTCDQHEYAKGAKIQASQIGCNHNIFNEIGGFHIVWYTDSGFTKKADQEIVLNDDTTIYGRYEKDIYTTHFYAHYELANPINYKGITYRYITEEDVDTLSAFLTKDVADDVTTYYYGDDVVLTDTSIVTESYTEISFDYKDYLEEGFDYDATNPKNILAGYAQTEGLALRSYFERKSFNLTIDQNVPGSSTTTYVYKYGANVNIDALLRNGYIFDGWKITNSGVDYSDSTHVINADKSIKFRMPLMSLNAQAQWVPDYFNQEVIHYYQNNGSSFLTTAVSNLGSEIKNDVQISLEGGTAITGCVYDGGAVSYEVDGKIWYYSTSELKGGIYYVYIEDLTFVKETVSVLQEAETEISSLTNDVDNYNFSFIYYKKDDSVTTLTEGTFVNDYGMAIEYYYTIDDDIAIELTSKLIDSDSEEIDVTMLGERSYFYAEPASLFVSIPLGYTFVGWYDATDVLDTEGKLLTGLDFESEALVPVSTNENFTFKAKASHHYVAIISADAVAKPNIVISGIQQLTYGYGATSETKVTALVSFDEGASSANYVSSYQWYLNDVAVTEGGNSATYLIPAGWEADDYKLTCYVTVARRDNGKSAGFMSEDHIVTVGKRAMSVSTTPYAGTYDALTHDINLTISNPNSSENYEVYYALEELTSENYATVGSKTKPAIKDVKIVDNAVVSNTVYYYIKSLTTNFSDYAGSEEILINPAPLTIEAGESTFHKTYDSYSEVKGSISENGTDLYSLVHNKDVYSIRGLKGDDEAKTGYFIYADAEYNSPHIEEANTLTLSDIVLMNEDNTPDKNYYFPADYSVELSAYIDKLQLTLEWSGTEFKYNGEKKCPTATIETTIPEADEENLSLEIAGGQINAGDYTSTAKLVSSASSTYISDFGLVNGSQAFTIERLEIIVAPKDDEVLYDGENHTLTEFVLAEGSATMVYGDLIKDTTAYFVKNNEKYTYASQAGKYEYKAENSKVIATGTEEDVTDNYIISYETGKLTIHPRPITFSGVTGVGKVYDKTNVAALNFDNIVAEGLIGSDTAGFDCSKITGTFDDYNVGEDKIITLNVADGLVTNLNYYLDKDESQKDATADITKAVITVTAQNASTIYGVNPTFTCEYSGFKGSDTKAVITNKDKIAYRISSEELEEWTTYNTQEFTSSTPVGKYYIYPFIDELEATNYSFVGAKAELEVTPREIAVKVVEGNDLEGHKIAFVKKQYDGKTTGTITDAMYEFVGVAGNANSGIINDDEVKLSYKAAFNSKDVATANSIVVSDLAIDNSNYKLVTTQLNVDGQITPVALTIKVKDVTKTYGITENPTYSVDYTGFISGENKSVLTGSLAFACNYDCNDAAKRNVGTYNIKASGLTSSNYEISYVDGTLTIDPAKINVYPTATKRADNDTIVNLSIAKKTGLDTDKASRYYGVDPIPEFNWNFDESELKYNDQRSVVSGTVTYDYSVLTQVLIDEGKYVINSTPTDYDITPVTTGLTATNYEIVPVVGILKVAKYRLGINGIKINGKVYDGTTEVFDSQFNYGEVIFDGLLDMDKAYFDAHPEVKLFTVEGEYTDANVAEDIDVNITITFCDYLADRCYYADNCQKVATADITKRPLLITATDKSVKYAANAPTYGVTYGAVEGEPISGLVTGATANANNVTITCPYVASPTFTEAGEYEISVSDFVSSTTLNANNYEPTYKSGKLTVTASQLAAPSGTWSTTTPGLFTWNQVSNVGKVAPYDYVLTLYKDGTALTDEGATVTVLAADTLEANFADLIHAKGPGKYTVSFYAEASTENNADYKNVVKVGKSATSGAKYATTVQFVYNNDTITNAAKDTISINSAASTTVIAGESGVAIAAELVNETGYAVLSVTSNSALLTIDNTTIPEGAIKEYNNTVSLSNSLNNSNTITVTLKLKAIPATLDVVVTPRPGVDQATAVYGYSTADAPKLTATASVTSSDNVTTDGYTYTYEWTLKDITTILDNQKYEDQDTNTSTWTIKNGLNANLLPTYYVVQCKVRATRKDNGQFVDADTNYSYKNTKSYVTNITITRASFSAKAQIEGWNYGEARSVPSLYDFKPSTITAEEHPGISNVVYRYVEKSVYDADHSTTAWSESIPTNAGEYYMVAYIPASTNYDEFTTPMVDFKIIKNRLDDPENLTMDKTISASYGKAVWDAVEGFKENEGTDSESEVGVNYTVKVYRKNDDGTYEINSEKYELVSTHANIDETSYEILIDMQTPGTYVYSVQATDVEETGLDNCHASNEVYSGKYIVGAKVEIYDNSEKQENGYTREYNAKDITLKLEFAVDVTGLDLAYQWYKDGELISGANSDSYKVRYVTGSGSYDCVVSSEATIYSTIATTTIEPTDITLVSGNNEKIYDATALTKDLYWVGETSPTLDDASNPVSTFTNVGSTSTSVVDHLGNIVSGVQVTGSVTKFTSTTTNNNTLDISNMIIKENDVVVYGTTSTVGQNYEVSTTLGTLKVTPRAVTIKADSMNKMYDGTPLTMYSCVMTDGITGDKDNFATSSTNISSVTGDTFVITMTDSITTYAQGTEGVIDNTIKSVTIKNAGSENVDNCYTVTLEKGKLTINKRPITVTASSSTRAYNGVALTDSSINVDKAYGIASTDKIISTNTGSITDVGKTDNVITSIKIENASKTDVTSSYAITTAKGTLTIVPLDINKEGSVVAIVDAISDYVYDGTKKDPTTDNKLVVKANLTKAPVPGTNAAAAMTFGTDYAVALDSNVNAGEARVVISGTGNYCGNYETSFKINPLPVELTWTNDKFVYDKTEKSITASITNIKNNASKEGNALDVVSVATYSDNAKTNAGNHTANALTLTGENAGNYTLVNGTNVSKAWTIAPKEVTIKWYTDPDCTVEYTKGFDYNKQAHTVYPDVVEKESGDTFLYTYDASDVHSATAIGSYKAIVSGLGNTNYKLKEEASVVTPTASLDWSILALEVTDLATVSGTMGNNNWFVSNVTVTAPDGFLISDTYDGTYQSAITLTAEGKNDIKYYLQRVSDGALTDKVTEALYSGNKVTEVYLDLVNPTGDIKFKNSIFKSINADAVLALYAKDSASINISAADTTNGSGVDKIYYYVSDAVISNPTTISSWTESSSVTLTAPCEKYIYAKFVDKAGRESIINSFGIVVYTDPQSTSIPVEYVRTSKLDKTFDIESNKNTLKEVKLGSTVLTNGVDYDFSYIEEKGKISFTLKKEFLETLASNTNPYGLSISYYPNEVLADIATTSLPADENGNVLAYADNQVPATTPISLTVNKAQPIIDVVDNQTKVYDGNTVEDSSYTVTYPYQAQDSTSAHTTYYLLSDGGATRTLVSGKPWRAGEYVAVVTRDADEYYYEANKELVFAITTKNLVVKGKSATKVYDATPLTQPDYEFIESTSLATGDSATVTMTSGSTITNVGTAYNAVDTVLINRSGEDVTDCYNIKKITDETSGTLTITKAPVTITINDSYKTYGDDDPTFTVNSVVGLIDDNDLGTVSVERLNKDVDVDAATYEDVLDAVYTPNGNYEITVNKGDFVINPLPVIFAWDYDTFFYTALDNTVTATVTNVVGSDTFELTYDDTNIAKAVGDYTATVYGLGNTNYTLVGATNVNHDYSIVYAVDGIAKVTGETKDGPEENSEGWYITPVVLTPENEGFLISLDEVDWQPSIEINKTDKHHESYHLKEIATGYVTEEKFADFNQDVDAPEVTIKLTNTSFDKLLSNIAYEYFFKNAAPTEIVAVDQENGSEIDTIEYQVLLRGTAFDENGTWTAGDKFTLDSLKEYVIYARVFDKAGNSTIISSDGLIVFLDSIARTESVEYTKATNENIVISVNLNDNTIEAVKINGVTLRNGSDYNVASDGSIVISGLYLQSLTAGNYEIVVSYNPLGEVYSGKGDGEAPATTTTKLVISKATGSVEITKMDSKEADGNPVNDPEYNVVGDGEIVIEYKKANEPDSAYTTKAPTEPGEYTVRVTLLESENYTGAVDTKNFTITAAKIIEDVTNENGNDDGDSCFWHIIMIITCAIYVVVSLLTAKQKNKDDKLDINELKEEMTKSMKSSKTIRWIASIVYIALMALFTHLGSCEYDLLVALITGVISIITTCLTYKHKFKAYRKELN